MAGTLTISTLSDGTNSTSATNCISGSAKAWVNFNGTINAGENRRASYNVSSVTKNGTGVYTVNFTNAFADANYCPVLAPQYASANQNSFGFGGALAAPTTTSCQIAVAQGGSAYDPAYCAIGFFR